MHNTRSILSSTLLQYQIRFMNYTGRYLPAECHHHQQMFHLFPGETLSHFADFVQCNCCLLQDLNHRTGHYHHQIANTILSIFALSWGEIKSFCLLCPISFLSSLPFVSLNVPSLLTLFYIILVFTRTCTTQGAFFAYSVLYHSCLH